MNSFNQFVKELKSMEGLERFNWYVLKPIALMILKDNGLGVRKTLTPFIEDNIIDAHLSKDKKTFSGVLKGDKTLATFKLSHRQPFEMKASSMLKLERFNDA